ncbi:CDP-diacylglycerol--glycerol-3-phosphate 3-phosphatidyltransferase [Mycetocola sp.]|uniref:CDP-diacylglycerol--glycerol-3-phosphate 3-phosphatidyltransferase n=1 Tax=Mycetocola sp. TaxID=1871042 RepID=UPI002639D403|nr:CDP-diacylglycerol--glycerol-3-phosphate 3-phosphatidyltransferase [Mycetocola sp.]MCU1560644.1 Cardiolipin synthase [Mycetocola sp.]
MEHRAEPEASDRILTVPNILSFLRLALVPVFLVLLVEGEDLAALAVLALSGFTDFLDGYLARRLNQVSKLGQLLDPAADRLYILAALLGLGWRDLIPLWLVVVIIARDVMLIALAAWLAKIGHGAFPVNWVGKWATACLFVGLPLLMLAAAFPATAVVTQPVGLIVAILGAALYWWAGGLYLLQTVRASGIPKGQTEPQSDTLEP